MQNKMNINNALVLKHMHTFYLQQDVPWVKLISSIYYGQYIYYKHKTPDIDSWDWMPHAYRYSSLYNWEWNNSFVVWEPFDKLRSRILPKLICRSKITWFLFNLSLGTWWVQNFVRIVTQLTGISRALQLKYVESINYNLTDLGIHMWVLVKTPSAREYNKGI